ncbi:transcriptional regulator [Flavonifractor plautii]|nr:helix-turn-helix domain-containing protein [Flavonifractor plautii]ARE59899.1 transcriptional regulator [Flavonifractor plautii]MCR1908481.1 helix-turn-helix transcriptional regulator [Flavonifractor plautii]OXE48017.1 transcriptional regulator [Flavonifractor plautii]
MSNIYFQNRANCKKDFDCSLGFAMTVIGSKWRAIILWHIMKNSPIRYGRLKSQIRGISHKVFTEELKQLEEDGLIKRSAYATIPPKVEYTITELGKTLEPILSDLCNWGRTYI